MAIQGGATTINQYLAAGLIDELRLDCAAHARRRHAAVRGRPAAETRAGEVAGSETGHARDLPRAVLSWRAVTDRPLMTLAGRMLSHARGLAKASVRFAAIAMIG